MFLKFMNGTLLEIEILDKDIIFDMINSNDNFKDVFFKEQIYCENVENFENVENVENVTNVFIKTLDSINIDEVFSWIESIDEYKDRNNKAIEYIQYLSDKNMIKLDLSIDNWCAIYFEDVFLTGIFVNKIKVEKIDNKYLCKNYPFGYGRDMYLLTTFFTTDPFLAFR